MQLKYFLRKRNDELFLDSIVDTDAEKAEAMDDFHRWWTEEDSKNVKFVPPDGCETWKEWYEKTLREWRG